MAATNKSKRQAEAKLASIYDRIRQLKMEEEKLGVPTCRYCCGLHDSIAHNDDRTAR